MAVLVVRDDAQAADETSDSSSSRSGKIAGAADAVPDAGVHPTLL